METTVYLVVGAVKTNTLPCFQQQFRGEGSNISDVLLETLHLPYAMQYLLGAKFAITTTLGLVIIEPSYMLDADHSTNVSAACVLSKI